MTSTRHFSFFVALGLFWGLSPSLYRYLADNLMPVTYTIVLSGLGVGVLLYVIRGLRQGWQLPSFAIARYGAICAGLMNIPFALNLYLAGFVPPAELAIIITMSPFFNYLLALVTGKEDTQARRLIAIAFGFISTLVLILSREGTLQGEANGWLLAAISIPLLYCAYNNYAANFAPAGSDTLMLGAAESIWSGLLVIPFLLVMAPLGAASNPPLFVYWAIGFAILMWIVERIAYFTLIREKGAVYTVQATYLSTPAAVAISAALYGGGTDIWLWVSLALLMCALWFNNTGQVPALKPVATQPYS
jgi:drug/metabolite transporter (DMT)-like permease